MNRVFCAALTAVLLALALTGCSAFPFGVNTEEMLRAPQAGAAQTAVQKALTSYLNETPQLKYPRGGDVSAPLLFTDLDGDGVREAVVTYLAPSRGRNVRIAVLEPEEGGWRVSVEQEGLATEVAGVELTALLGTGTQLVVGYANSNLADKYLAVYDYREGTLARLCEQAYNEYKTDDFIGDGSRQLVLVQSSAQEGALSLQVYEASADNTLVNVQTLMLDERFVSCRGLYLTKTEDRRGLIVDGKFTSGSISCEVFSVVNRSFYKWPGDEVTDVPQRTLRFLTGLVPTDFSGMGAKEVPVGVLSVSTLSSTRRFYLVSWYDFLQSNLPSETAAQSAPQSEAVKQQSGAAGTGADTAPEQDARWRRYGVYDASYGYFVALPKAWQGSITLEDGILADEWQVRDKENGTLLVSVRVPERTATLGRYTHAATLEDRSVYVYVSDACTADESRAIRTGVTVLK